MSILEDLYTYLEEIAEVIPVEVYAFIGGLIEEIVAPIPSPIIMTTAGGIVLLQDGNWINLIIISLIAALGKTIGSLILYILADKMEDFFVIRYGKFFGIDHQTIEDIGKRFKGGGKDIGVLSLLRAIPVIPGAPVAVACGAIKLDMKTYIISTYIGTFFRSLFFAFIGYLGVESYGKLMESMDNIESALTVLSIILIFAAILYIKKLSEKKQNDQNIA
jgi:membrane protein DedA with SNARE-associated domain